MTSRAQKISEHLYFTGLLLLVAGMPVSLFLTSLSQFFLAASFLIGNPIHKFKRFFSNKPAMLIAGIWLLHLIGLLWTSDMHEGLKDLRIKLPLLILPLIIAGNQPLSASKIRWVLLTFVFSVFCGTMVSMAVLEGVIHKHVVDIRDVFIFNISHIRFSLFACLSIFILFYYCFTDPDSRPNAGLKLLGVLLVIWLLIFLVIVVSVTGLLVFAITAFVLLLLQTLSNSSLSKKIGFIFLLIAVPVTMIYALKHYLVPDYKRSTVVENKGEKTKLGNDYDPTFVDSVYENGYPVWDYVCEKELRESWNVLSDFKYDSLDERQQPMRLTLIRFLTSKGLRKDAEGVSMLNSEERRTVESGVANVNYVKLSSLKSRLQQIAWEIDQYWRFKYTSGHSVTQRLEFWRAGWLIASDNMMTGVGTGDMPAAYVSAYKQINTSLDESHRLRAHNQFLAILVAFGVFGLFYFIVALLYPFFSNSVQVNMLFVAFFLIVFFSMFSEDTLETQAGVTFFAFFFMVLMINNFRGDSVEIAPADLTEKRG